MMNIADLLFLWKPLVEVTILWFVIYHIMLFFEGTRAVSVLRGIVVLIVAFLLFQILGLHILDWMLTKIFAISVIALLIIFHPEIRQGLSRLGRQRYLFGAAYLGQEELDYVLKQVTDAVDQLSKNKVGALIAIEKSEPLNSYVESGVKVDSLVSSELIQTIFTPNSMLHDGGLILQHDRIVAAGCLFPLTSNPYLSRIYGTRHRAALGLSEETDAIIVIVSEERREISLVYQGKLEKDLKREDIFNKVKEIIKTKKKND
ncbi:diadenylate cyclase CdaA [Candidatus Omnitrophota bacterium]